jgi:hypothetical protein
VTKKLELLVKIRNKQKVGLSPVVRMDATDAALEFLARMPKHEKAELVKWHDAMDKLVGPSKHHLFLDQDIPEGLRMAKECEHEDAKWLVSLFPETTWMTPEVLLKQGNGPRAMYFAECIAPISGPFGALNERIDRLQQIAELGYAPAQAWAAGASFENEEERFALARKAAVQGDRDGLYELATCFQHGIGCETDEYKALMTLKEAAEMGHPVALCTFGELGFEESNWNRYLWWGRAAAKGNKNAMYRLSHAAVQQVEVFKKGGSGRIVFEIGAAFEMPDFKNRFGRLECRDEVVPAVDLTIALHGGWCRKAKESIFCWIWVARQKKVVKDIRNIICKMLWADRGSWSDGAVENHKRTLGKERRYGRKEEKRGRSRSRSRDKGTRHQSSARRGREKRRERRRERGRDSNGRYEGKTKRSGWEKGDREKRRDTDNRRR